MSLDEKDNYRFAFGENWARFLKDLNETRIAEAESSLKALLGVEDLKNPGL